MSEISDQQKILSAQRFVIGQYVWVAPIALWILDYLTKLDEEVEYPSDVSTLGIGSTFRPYKHERYDMQSYHVDEDHNLQPWSLCYSR
jgi:hypothetical protein